MSKECQTLTNYVKRITALFLQAGVTNVIISPGSRSTPLAYAFAATKQMNVYLQIDERSASYFALGMAKASGQPTILLCTSGTAAANYYPAVIEARYARIPLIVLTADRPHELREVGAPQAIDQIELFGKHVKNSVDMPIPDDHIAVESFIDRHIQRSISLAMTSPKGPVHLNFPFREPLLIDLQSPMPSVQFQQSFTSKDILTDEAVTALQSIVEKSKKGLLIVGELPVTFNRTLFWQFASSLQWPILCDPLSNLRSEVPFNNRWQCIDHYDALLKSEKFREQMKPDVVIRFGAQPVSKSLAQFLANERPACYVTVDESPTFRDSIGAVTHHFQSNPEAICRVKIVSEKSTYAHRWEQANVMAQEVFDHYAEVDGDEGLYMKQLFANLPTKIDLFSGSSMPIRDVDTFFRKTKKDIRIFSNRGTNGIDGVVSSAFGMQAARKRPGWLLIGDLSFLHDQNGLLVSRFHDVDLTIVVMNNNGGGIFSYLPQATIPHHFEQLFGTPTNLSLEHVATMYGAQYAGVDTIEAFQEELSKQKKTPVRLIEVITNRQVSVEAHRNYWQQVVKRLEKE